MKKVLLGLLFGAVAGIIDVIPMIIQDLTWDANISAFLMWVVIGLLISLIKIRMNSIIKGIFIAFLVLLPNAVLIGWSEPFTLLPITGMTLFLGGLLGYVLGIFDYDFKL